MKRVFFAFVALFLSVATNAGVIAQDPLFISAQADPRVMLCGVAGPSAIHESVSDYSTLTATVFSIRRLFPYIEYDGISTAEVLYVPEQPFRGDGGADE